MRRTFCLTILVAALSTTATAENKPFKVFFADLHSHTSYSDGKLKPADAHKYARETAKLDVFILTDHLESVNDPEWKDTCQVVDGANEGGSFVTFPGIEWTKKWGHCNIYGAEIRVWPNDPAEFYKAAADAGVILKFNHPGNGTKSHAGLAYSEIGDRAVQAIEVRKTDEEAAYIRALDNGWHLAPDGSSDTHSPNWGNRGRWTGILATELSREAIWDAMKNRRVYSSLDRNCRLSFKANGAQMGSIVEKPAKAVKIAVQVSDPDEGDDIAKIELFEDGKVVQVYEPNKRGTCWLAGCSPPAGKHYYFAKVTQADGNLLWSAPVWVTVGG